MLGQDQLHSKNSYDDDTMLLEVVQVEVDRKQILEPDADVDTNDSSHDEDVSGGGHHPYLQQNRP